MVVVLGGKKSGQKERKLDRVDERQGEYGLGSQPTSRKAASARDIERILIATQKRIG